MTDIGELLSAALILVVGAGVIAILAGANAAVVSDLITSGVTLIVYVGVVAILALVFLNIVRSA